MFRPNRLKRRLDAGERALGGWLFMGSPAATEIMARCGFDALIIDQEHSPGGLETGIEQLRGAAGTDVTMLWRLADNQPMPVRHALDAGAEGLLAANVETAADAERLVDSSHYPPVGSRTAHFTVSRAAGWGVDATSYAESIHDNLLVIAMIESARGVAAIPEIARVPGIDMLFLGPLDLSASIDRMGRYDDPAMCELIDEAERRTIEASVVLGGPTYPGASAAVLFERGYRFVTAASDVALLRDSARQAAESAAGSYPAKE